MLRARFDEIDSSGDGSLDEEELLQVFEALGSPVTPNLIANLIRLADDDGNGTIEWPEFLKIFQVLEKMEEKEKEKRRLGGFVDDDASAGAVKPTGKVAVPA